MNKGVVWARLCPISYESDDSYTPISVLLPDSFNDQYRELAFPALLPNALFDKYMYDATLMEMYHLITVETYSSYQYPNLSFTILEINSSSSVPATDLFSFSGKVHKVFEDEASLLLDDSCILPNLLYGDIDDIEVNSNIEVFVERVNRHLVINNWKKI